MTKEIKRGDIYYANIGPVIGSEQGGIRPVLIIQNDIGNQFSPTVIAAMITSKVKKKLPTHVDIPAKTAGLHEDSVILTEQIKTLDKSRLRGFGGRINEETMAKVNRALLISVGVDTQYSLLATVG